MPAGVARVRWIGFATFIVRAYKDIAANFILTIAPPAVSTALYLLIFGSFMGGRIGGFDGISYQRYMAPGLILLPVITASYGQAALSLVVAKQSRTLDEHLVSPQPGWMIVASYVAAGSMRGMLVGAATGFVVLLLADGAVEHVAMTIGTVILVALTASLAGFINGLFATTLEQVHWVLSFVLTPMTYLGGVFFPVALLPHWARHLSLADPCVYMVDLLRYSMCGVSDIRTGLSILIMSIVAFAMLAVGGFLIDRGIGIRE